MTSANYNDIKGQIIFHEVNLYSIKIFTRIEFFFSNKCYLSTIIRKKGIKMQQNLYYLPIQKSLKILPNISSTSTFPTIIPRCLVANLKSSAALSKSFLSFFSEKLFK